MTQKILKKRRVTFCAVGALIAVQSFAQNVYDTYNPWNPTIDSVVLSYPYDNAVQNYIGEYQLFTDGLEAWQGHLVVSTTYSISYKIEPVSFPFIPDCSNGDCGNSSSTIRHLIMPDSLNYGDFIFEKPFKNLSDSMETMSDEGQLVSQEFTRTLPTNGTRATSCSHSSAGKLSCG